MNKRVFGLDLVRVVAVFLVIVIHSFLYTGYNSTSMSGIGMFMLLLLRCLARSGVLIFIILTGYLKSDKKVDKGYYKGITNILLTYFIIAILTIIFRKVVLHDEMRIAKLIISIFSFNSVPYAWYVEMYLGLFFFIPFLNILYKNISSRKKKRNLIITLFLFSSLFPTLSRICIADLHLDLYPDWWSFLYPIMLYYVGSYIKEYKITFNKWIILCLLSFIIFFDAFILYFYLSGGIIDSLLANEYYTLSVIISILVFLLLYDIKAKGKVIPGIFSFLSKLAFGTFLISFSFDSFIYKNITFLHNKYYYFLFCILVIPPIIFILSSICSYFINLIVKGIRFVGGKISQRKITN